MKVVSGLVLSVLLPSMLFAGGAEAAVRKCSLGMSPTVGLFIVDEVRAETFALERVDGRSTIPRSVFDGFPPGEVVGAEVGCIEEVDTVTGRPAVYLTVHIFTKTNAVKRLRDLIVAQEAYRESRGYYAASLAILQAFGAPVNMRNVRFNAVDDGWSARIGDQSSGRGCSVAVGITPPDPGAEPGEIVCY